MGLLNSQLQADAAFIMADVDAIPGSEEVVYTKPDGTTRTINAVVQRDPPGRVTPGGELVLPKLSVTVANDATYGITSAEVDARGADRITVAERIGQTAKAFAVYVPEAGAGPWHNAGFLTLELR
jgi:hypothetical protein